MVFTLIFMVEPVLRFMSPIQTAGAVLAWAVTVSLLRRKRKRLPARRRVEL